MAVPFPTFALSDKSGGGCPTKRHAINMEHLSRQTMGDKSVEREVLAIFIEQARGCIEELARVNGLACKAIAHRMLGASRGIGAFAVAEAAQALEEDPSSTARIAAVRVAVDEAESFIREYCL